MQDPITQNEDGWLKDILSDERAASPYKLADDNEFFDRLNGLLKSLDKRERLILLMRYGLDGTPPKTLDEVSRIIGRTRERVRQIQNKALQKMKNLINDDCPVEEQNSREYLFN